MRCVDSGCCSWFQLYKVCSVEWIHFHIIEHHITAGFLDGMFKCHMHTAAWRVRIIFTEECLVIIRQTDSLICNTQFNRCCRTILESRTIFVMNLDDLYIGPLSSTGLRNVLAPVYDFPFTQNLKASSVDKIKSGILKRHTNQATSVTEDRRLSCTHWVFRTCSDEYITWPDDSILRVAVIASIISNVEWIVIDYPDSLCTCTRCYSIIAIKCTEPAFNEFHGTRRSISR